MSNHTPGPWDLEPIPYPEDGDDGWYLHRANQEPIFISSDEVSPDDARLIAAAPELLEALQKTTDWLNQLHADQRPEFLEECYDAIAKATL